MIWNIKYLLLLSLLTVISLTNLQASAKQDYEMYHQQVNRAEELIASKKYEEALKVYEGLFAAYDFVFLREYQIATQLALHLNKEQKAQHYLKQGILSGWTKQSIKKNGYATKLRNDKAYWKTIKKEYRRLRKEYESSLNQDLRKQVKKMYKKDQWKAIGALFRIGDKAQEKYATRQFAPHSETQVRKLIEMLENQGYPGEKMIGNDFWMSTILSHHNSISQQYAKNDTLYTFILPNLRQAVDKGQMSPYEYAMIDDWQKAVVSDRKEPGYGFLNPPRQSTLSETNALRQKIGLRTIELRNKLVDVERTTGMDFYLPNWVEGKISIE